MRAFLQKPAGVRKLAARARLLLRSRWARRVLVGAAVALVSVTGVVVGTLLFAHTDIAVGPFRAEMSVSPSFTGGTEVDIPPLGSLHLDSHAVPSTSRSTWARSTRGAPRR